MRILKWGEGELDYDLAGRLEEVTQGSSVLASYVYDTNSNRTSQTIGSVVTTATYNDQDGVETFGTKSFTHNLNGEMVTSTDSASSTTTTYSFDVFGNLKSAVLPSKVISYKIDASNRRMAKLVDSNPVEYYIWNAEDKLIAIADENGIVTSRFVYGEESHSPDYMLTSTDSFQIIKNHLGSPVVVVNSSTGVVVQEVKYDEFGVVLSDTSPGFTPFGFAGCLYDQDTKLCKFGAREYDASIGRWLSKDPILFNGRDTNLYGYVLQDPVNFIDRTGKFPVPVAIIGIAGVANAIGSFTGTFIAGGSLGDAFSSASSGFVSGALTGATALGALYFGLPGGAAAVFTGIVTNTATSLINATEILGKDLPQGHMDFAKKACQ